MGEKLSSNIFDIEYLCSLQYFRDRNRFPIIWCYTGGGHLFEENFTEIGKINEQGIPILFIFSNSGVLVANRYGFFWNLKEGNFRKELLHFMFDQQLVTEYNILKLLKKDNFSYSFIPDDPAFSLAISLANSDIRCIIASPLTANSVSKLAYGCTDTFISNLITSGIKAQKKIAVVPTDYSNKIIKTKLPVRLKTSSLLGQIDPKICNFGALRRSNSRKIIFVPQYCVGCLSCVNHYPNVFSYGEIMQIKIREIDYQNTKKLSNELTILQDPCEIANFLKQMALD